jgi:hypothetical protein
MFWTVVAAIITAPLILGISLAILSGILLLIVWSLEAMGFNK